MTYTHIIAKHFKDQGWKVKIFAKELGREEPHLTIVYGIKKWRISLRTGDLMDHQPPIRELDPRLLEEIRHDLPIFVQKWDEMFPTTPVYSEED